MDEHGSLIPRDPARAWAVALSGGGLRATLFELGILLYLARAAELTNVTAIVSVSGGSILAAQLATRWKEASESPKGFSSVASDLIRFIRTDIRNRALIKWIWWHCPLITFLIFPSWRRIFFLERQYRRHFAKTTLGQLPSGAAVPLFAFVATDTRVKHRVALMPSQIVRFTFDGQPFEPPIVATGVHLSLAVAASSCFPPVFEILPLTYRDLGLQFREFTGLLNLSDGGVAGNLGVEVLCGLITEEIVTAKKMLFCDAERGLAEEPSDSAATAIDTVGWALSASARQLVERLGPNAKLLQFSNRTPEQFGLPFRVFTQLAKYRTDLDRPSWQECQALMIHGAAIAEQALSAQDLGRRPSSSEIHEAIGEILKGAGNRHRLPELKEEAFARCGRRRYWLLGLHAAVAVLVMSAACAVASEGVAHVHPSWRFRPISWIWSALCPEKVVPRTVHEIGDAVAMAVCDGAATVDVPVSGELSRIEITVGKDSDSSALIARTEPPNKCGRKIKCELTFWGRFPADEVKIGNPVTVIGRCREKQLEHSIGYVDFYECHIEQNKRPGQ